jgi:hypothetical protein
MPSYLVVADQTAHSAELLDRLREIAAADEGAEFVLVVPATPVRHLLVWEEGETLELARSRARDACSRLTAAGLRMAGCRVGDGDPLAALADAVAEHPGWAAVVVSTLPPGLSRWLGLDLVNRARRLLPGRSLIHVVSEPAVGRAGAGRG